LPEIVDDACRKDICAGSLHTRQKLCRARKPAKGELMRIYQAGSTLNETKLDEGTPMREQQDKNYTLSDDDIEYDDSVYNEPVSPKEAFDTIREQFHHVFDAIEDVDAFVAEQRGR
jgi:hypothetical protein